MAWITKETVNRITPLIKEVAKKHGLKVRIAGSNSMELKVTILSGRVDLYADYLGGQDSKIANRLTVNHYWIDRYFMGETKDALNDILAAMRSEWYDNSDSQHDYFDTAYYTSIFFGTFDKPYTVTK